MTSKANEKQGTGGWEDGLQSQKKVRSPKNGWDVFGGRAFSQHAQSTSTAEGWLLGTAVHACGLNTQETDARGSRGPDYEIKKLLQSKGNSKSSKKKACRMRENLCQYTSDIQILQIYKELKKMKANKTKKTE